MVKDLAFISFQLILAANGNGNGNGTGQQSSTATVVCTPMTSQELQAYAQQMTNFIWHSLCPVLVTIYTTHAVQKLLKSISI